ncbi:MAG: hypothetical protein U0W24_07955 [Bacteroidales bacterium]
MNPTDDKKNPHPPTKIDLMYHLINQGSLCYVAPNFNLQNFSGTVKEWLEKTQSLETNYRKTGNVNFIEYRKKTGISGTLGISQGYCLFYLFDKDILYFDIKPQKWFENPESKSSLLGNLLSDSFKEEITDFLLKYFLLLANQSEKLRIDTRNHYVDAISEKKKIWFTTHFKQGDLLLAFLEISAIKKNDGKLQEKEGLKWYLVLSSSDTRLVSFNEREEEFQSVNLENNAIVVKNELGRNPVEFGDIKLLSTRSNAVLFYHIQKINQLKPDERIREIARLNWLYDKKNDKSNDFAIDLIEYLMQNYKYPFDELSLFYMQYSGDNREKVFSRYNEDEKLSGLLNHMLNYAGTNEFLTKWVKEWEISYIDLIAINNLFLKAISDTVQANNILPFHRLVREEFSRKNKDAISEIIFEITFSRHLIKCGLGKEAKKILSNCLEKLPDETVSDLLPASDVDLTGRAAGQIVKVTLLEILAGVETEKNAISIKRQIARLQPLVDERIETLIQVSDEMLSTKGKEIKLILQPNGLLPDKSEPTPVKYKILDQKIADKNLRHPAARKDGSFSNFQKWLASVNIPDYTVLKSYSEKLSPQKYPELNAVITDIKYTLNLENLDVYISHGEKSLGINGFESEPLFLIIGGDHLNPESANYLNHKELRFAIGVELAHLYFKHARITSSDVWKGAIEKGYFVLDTVLSLFPAVGIFSKSLQTIGQFNTISSFLQKTEKIGKISGKSRDLIKSSEQIVNLYKSKFANTAKDDREMEILVTSRIMQLTADRCAMIFTKNLKDAIRAMLLVSKRYSSEISVIEKYGLKAFFMKQDESGNFRHQDLALRIAHLFSFYLSEDYDTIVKSIEAGK